jgi:hypothetical protein
MDIFFPSSHLLFPGVVNHPPIGRQECQCYLISNVSAPGCLSSLIQTSNLLYDDLLFGFYTSFFHFGHLLRGFIIRSRFFPQWKSEKEKRNASLFGIKAISDFGLKEELLNLIKPITLCGLWNDLTSLKRLYSMNVWKESHFRMALPLATTVLFRNLKVILSTSWYLMCTVSVFHRLCLLKEWDNFYKFASLKYFSL